MQSLTKPVPWPEGLKEMGFIHKMYPFSRILEVNPSLNEEWKCHVIDTIGRLLLTLQAWNNEQTQIDRDLEHLFHTLKECAYKNAEEVSTLQKRHQTCLYDIMGKIESMKFMDQCSTDQLRYVSHLYGNVQTEINGLRQTYEENLANCNRRTDEFERSWMACEEKRRSHTCEPPPRPTEESLGRATSMFINVASMFVQDTFQKSKTFTSTAIKNAYWWYVNYNHACPDKNTSRYRRYTRTEDEEAWAERKKQQQQSTPPRQQQPPPPQSENAKRGRTERNGDIPPAKAQCRPTETTFDDERFRLLLNIVNEGTESEWNSGTSKKGTVDICVLMGTQNLDDSILVCKNMLLNGSVVIRQKCQLIRIPILHPDKNTTLPGQIQTHSKEILGLVTQILNLCRKRRNELEKK
jgi:hypothetical protein